MTSLYQNNLANILVTFDILNDVVEDQTSDRGLSLR